MKTLYLECKMGIAGDMLMSALFDLVDDKESVIEKIKSIGLPETTVSFVDISDFGISGKQARVLCIGEEEGEGTPHHHSHSTLGDVTAIINSLNVNDKVRQKAIEAYNIIAQAESRVHNCEITDVHFHEVGTLDAIADVVVCSYLLDLLSPDKIIVSPINLGGGTVNCAHGLLPVPAPATADILKGIECYSDDIMGELCTPTGAALVKVFAQEISTTFNMKLEKTGYGFGHKKFDRPNCLRAFFGEDNTDEVIELAANIDDMTAEELAYACEVLLENGALDVTQSAVTMKKSRLGIMLSVICKNSDREKLLSLIFKHTTTIGVREYALKRYTLERTVRTIETPLGPIDEKISQGYGVTRQKLEFDHLKRLAQDNNLSIEEVRKLVQK